MKYYCCLVIILSFFACGEDEAVKETTDITPRIVEKKSNSRYPEFGIEILEKTDVNGFLEKGEILTFGPKGYRGNSEDFLWAFGNGDEKTGRSVNYTYETADDFLVSLTIDGITIDKQIEITNSILTSPMDSIVKIVAPRKAFVGEEVIFKAYASGVNEWFWEFGEREGIVSGDRGAQAIHHYEFPGSYIVEVTTDRTEYPDTHLIQILEKFELIPDEPLPDSMNMAALDFKKYLQLITDTNLNNHRDFKRYSQYLIEKYICELEKVSVNANGEYYHFLDYCNSIHHLRTGMNEGLVIDEVVLDTFNCVKHVVVTQHANPL